MPNKIENVPKKLVIDGSEINTISFDIEVSMDHREIAFQTDNDTVYKYHTGRTIIADVKIKAVGVDASEDTIYLYTKAPTLEEWQKAYAQYKGAFYYNEQIKMALESKFETDEAKAFQAGYVRATEQLTSIRLEDYDG